MKVQIKKRSDWPEFDGPYNVHCYEKPWVVIWYPDPNSRCIFTWRKFENWTDALVFAIALPLSILDDSAQGFPTKESRLV